MKRFSVNWFLLVPILLSLIIVRLISTYGSALIIVSLFALLSLGIIFIKPMQFLLLFTLFYWFPSQINYGSMLETIFYNTYVTEAIIYLFFIFSFLLDIKKKKYEKGGIFRTSLLIPLVLFLLFGVLGFLSNGVPDRLTAFSLFRQMSIYTLVVYLVFLKFIASARDSEKIYLTLIIGGVLYAGLAFLFDQGYIGVPVFTAGRLGGQYMFLGRNFYYNANGISAQLCVIMPLAAMLWLNANAKLGRLIGFLSFVVISFLLVLTGTRASWIASAIAIIVVAFFSYKYGVMTIRKIVFLGMFIFFILAGVITKGLVGDQILSRIESAEVAGGFSGRVDLWLGGLRHVSENILGMGYSPAYPYIDMLNPHNLFIALALGSGVLGLIAFLWFIISWFKKVFAAVKTAENDDKVIYIASLGSILALLIDGITDVPIYNGNITILMAFIIFGCTMALRRNSLNG